MAIEDVVDEFLKNQNSSQPEEEARGVQHPKAEKKEKSSCCGADIIPVGILKGGYCSECLEDC